jgi:PAS domain S-box-containing protein
VADTVLSAFEANAYPMFRRSPSPMYVFHPESLAIVDVNDSGLEFFGHDRETLLRMRLPDAFPADQVTAQLEDLRTDIPSHRTWEHVRRDGALRLVETSPRRLTVGSVTLAFVIVVDVTERELARKELERTAQRFRAMLDFTPVGIAMCGRDFRFREANRTFCRMLGYSREQLLKLTFPDVTHPEDVDIDAHLATALFAGEIPSYTREKRYLSQAGQILWVRLTVSAIGEETGPPLFALATIQDITESREQAARARSEAIAARRTLHTLTSRETEILDEAQRGLTAREIAEHFTISPRTVESHLATAYRKLGVASRHQAVAVLDRLRAAAGDEHHEQRAQVRTASP